MSGICNAVMPAGAVECLKKAGKAQYLIIDALDVSFSSDADFVNLATNKAYVNETLKSYVLKLADYEVGTADPAVTTLDNTRNIVTNKPVPNATAFADMSFCDQQELIKTLKGGTYRIRIVTADNEVLGYKLTDGTIKGFKAEITALTKGMPQKSDVDKNVTLYLNFVSYEEFEASIIAVPDFNMGLALVEATPVGLNMSQTAAYAAGDLAVQINTRCSDGLTGLVTADFVILSSNVTTPTIVAVEGPSGAYTLTIQKSGPVDLVAGDSITFQVQKKTGSVVNFVSNQVKLTV
jgi:hypothetical protein